MTTPRKTTANRRKKAPAPDRAPGEAKERGTSTWEWAVAAVGGVILSGMVGYLVWDAIAGSAGGPPDITVAPAATIVAGDRYLVEIVVANRGQATGADVRVRGALIDGDQTLEESTVTFDFVPKQSTRRGGLYFAHDPHSARLSLRVEGYVEP
ncbi:MAG: hypothetical protein RLT05_22940 [Bauldia litoralis]